MPGQTGLIHLQTVLLLLFLPWAFGTVDTWSINAALGMVLWLVIQTVWIRWHELRFRVDWWICAPLLALVPVMACYIFLQGGVNPFGGGGSRFALTPAVAGLPCSVKPAQSLPAVLLWAGWVGLAWVVAMNFRHKSQRTFLVWVLVANVVLLVLVALVQRYTGTQKVLWVRPLSFLWDWKTIGRAPFMGPFINRGHFSMYLCLIFPLVVYLWHLANRSRKVVLGVLADTHIFLMIFIGLVVFTVVFTGSRGALMVLLVVGMMSLFFQSGVIFKHSRLAVLLGMLVAVAMVALFLKPQMLDRLMDTFVGGTGSLATDSRWLIWTNSAELVPGSPIWGWGPGTYANLFVMVQDPRLIYRVDFPHNDYLQLLIETGALGSLLVALFAVAVAWRLAVKFRSLTSRSGRTLVKACMISTAGILVYALVDFPLQMAGLSLTAAAVVGIAFSVKDEPPMPGDDS